MQGQQSLEHSIYLALMYPRRFCSSAIPNYHLCRSSCPKASIRSCAKTNIRVPFMAPCGPHTNHQAPLCLVREYSENPCDALENPIQSRGPLPSFGYSLPRSTLGGCHRGLSERYVQNPSSPNMFGLLVTCDTG